MCGRCLQVAFGHSETLHNALHGYLSKVEVSHSTLEHHTSSVPHCTAPHCTGISKPRTAHGEAAHQGHMADAGQAMQPMGLASQAMHFKLGQAGSRQSFSDSRAVGNTASPASHPHALKASPQHPNEAVHLGTHHVGWFMACRGIASCDWSRTRPHTPQGGMTLSVICPVWLCRSGAHRQPGPTRPRPGSDPKLP